MNCQRCGQEMTPTKVEGVFLCKCWPVAYDNGKWLGCTCGFCQDQSWGYRMNQMLNETGLRARGVEVPEVFIYGEPGHGEGI